MTTRFAALGDSITVGLGDPVPGGLWRGFAALLAGCLPPPAEFRNLATSGATTSHVAGEQLAEAVRWRPHVATVVVGCNDILRGSFDIKAIGARLHGVVEQLGACGTTVVTICLPEPGRMLRLPKALARPLARRVNAVNDIIHELASRYPIAHAHAATHAHTFDRRMWSIDRLHPSERGHRLLARLCHDALLDKGFPVGAAPSAEPDQPPPTRRSRIWWMATKGTRWVLRRSTDLLPQLLGLAAAESRGMAAELDHLMANEVAAVNSTFSRRSWTSSADDTLISSEWATVRTSSTG
jgi:lysophospholipase L1-like esterase